MYEELIKSLRSIDEYDTGYAKLIYDAADAIEELEKAAPRWIPMTERLPEEGKFVLVYGDLYPNKHDGSVIAVSKRMDWNYWQGFGRERNITHWMPLPSAPEPPKEETC